MKKVILSVLTLTMILSNIAIFSEKTGHANTADNSTVSSTDSHNVYRAYSTDPY